MSKAEALTKIFELARLSHTRKVSDLSNLEKHAVAFCCSYFPAVISNGKLKYSRDAKETDLSVEFVLMNSLGHMLGIEFRKFVAASVHVWPDQELPKYERAPYVKALEAYPDILYIPNNKNVAYEHLPHIKLPVEDITVEDLKTIVALELYAMQAYKFHPELELTKEHNLIVRVMRENPEDVAKLEERFDLEILEWAKSTPYKKYALTSRIVYHPEDFKDASYLSAFIFSIKKGIYLSPNSAEGL